MRHSTGQRTITAIVADQLLGRTDLVGRLATLDRAGEQLVIGIEPSTIRRRVLAQLTGLTARRRLAPFARRRFSSTIGKRRATGDRAAERRVTVFPTCLVEYRRPQIGTALVDVYAQNRIAWVRSPMWAAAARPGSPPATPDGSRLRRRVTSPRCFDRAIPTCVANRVVVAQPTCHAVITTDYVDHVGGSDAELVAGRTFDALRYLAEHVAHAVRRWVPRSDWSSEPDRDRTRRPDGGRAPTTDRPSRAVPRLGDESPSPARRLLEMTGATVDDVRRSTGVDARWALRVANEPIALAIARELGAEIERSSADVVSGSCVLTNSSIAEQTGREVVHPFELLAGSSNLTRHLTRRRGRRRGGTGDAA